MKVSLQDEERRSRKARMLLSPALGQTTGVWAELGCGDGVVLVHAVAVPALKSKSM
jgi:hypothetical protein